MADNKINFSIGSIFSDEGFKKLNTAVKSAGRETKNAQGIFRDMLSEASQVDGAMGQMAGKIGGVVQAFATMGVVGGVLAVVKEGVDVLVTKLKEMEEEYDSVWQKMNAEIDATNIQAYAARMNELKSALQHVKDVTIQNIATFDQMASSIATMSSAIAKVEGASGNLTISQMMVKRFNDIMAQENEAGKKVVEAKWNLAIAEEQTAQRQEALEAERIEAERQHLFAQQRVTQVEDALAAAKENLQKATETSTFAEQKWGNTSKEYLDSVAKRTEAQNTVTALERQLADSKLKSNVAEQQVTAATLALKDAQVAGELKIKEASAAFEAASEAVTKVTQEMVEASWEEAAIEQKNILLENLEAQSAFGLSQQEATRALELFRQQIEMGKDADLARAEVEQQLLNEKLAREKENKEIELLAKNSNTNVTAAREAYAEALGNGYKDQEAYNAALKKLKDNAEGLSDQMGTTADGLKAGQTTSATSASANVSVKIDPKEIKKGTEDAPVSIRELNTDVNSEMGKANTTAKNLDTTMNSIATLIGQAGVLKGDASTKWATDHANALDTVIAKKLQDLKLDDKGREALADRVYQKHMVSKKQQEAVNDYIKRMCEATETCSGKKQR